MAFCFKISAAFLSASIKVTCEAPRERASSPSAPVPAKTSRIILSLILSLNELKRANFSREPIGCVTPFCGALSSRPRKSPEVILTLVNFPWWKISRALFMFLFYHKAIWQNRSIQEWRTPNRERSHVQSPVKEYFWFQRLNLYSNPVQET